MNRKRRRPVVARPSAFSLRQREMERLEELRAILMRAGAQDIDSYLVAKVADFRKRCPSSGFDEFSAR